jgi:hypothetical protein
MATWAGQTALGAGAPDRPSSAISAAWLFAVALAVASVCSPAAAKESTHDELPQLPASAASQEAEPAGDGVLRAPGGRRLDLAPGSSRAQKHEAENAISARILAGALRAHGRTFQMGGFGVAYERVIADGLLAVEVAAEMLASADAIAFPIELILEKPIEVAEHVELYIGAGPTWVPHLIGNRFHLGWGAIGIAGVELELWGPLATFLELDTAFVFLDGDVILEADVGTGVIFRF